MEITRKLMDEHQLILAYIAQIREMAGSQTNNQTDLDRFFLDMQTVVTFIRDYADHYHHAKEEDILFKALELPGVLSHCNPLPIMLSDHEIGRAHVREIVRAIETKNLSLAVEQAVAWANHLENHIYKEDNVLYVMAEEGLGEAEKAKIGQAYAAVEAKLGGERLERVYQAALVQMRPEVRA